MSSSYKNQKFIKLLALPLETDHHTVVKCTGDANTVVASSVTDHYCTGGNVEIIAAYTNLLILLLYFWNCLIGELIMKSEATKNYKPIKRDIGNITEWMGGY